MSLFNPHFAPLYFIRVRGSANKRGGFALSSTPCHCEEHSDEAISIDSLEIAPPLLNSHFVSLYLIRGECK
jgi:hypothetical protein